MIITNHWSASPPQRLNEYHVEIALNKALPSGYNLQLGQTTDMQKVDWEKLKSYFDIFKNTDFDIPTNYGTYLWNHDSRDGSSNIEVSSLCMGGESVTPSGSWGQWPFTYAHFLMHAAINARIAELKNIDVSGSFGVGPWPNGMTYQNGPLYNVSTHGERAIQTPDSPDNNLRPNFGYYIFSGDPDSRYDIAAPDVSENQVLSQPQSAFDKCKETANKLRTFTHDIKSSGIQDYWSLDK